MYVQIVVAVSVCCVDICPPFPPQAESDQRLIYSGKLLPDQLHVRDIFRKVRVCAYSPKY